MPVTKNTAKINYVSHLPELRAQIQKWRDAGETIALVPTMGALHDGHLSLARKGKLRCNRLVVSIFVNPTQFGPKEDFSVYPRTLETDLVKLEAVDCDLVWAPTAEVMYPENFATTICPKGAADGLETDFRPQFFSGVATVCCKLFMQVLPDLAIFGEKDYQQLYVVRQMVLDLNLPLDIIGCETQREQDGLAMSSRNAYLSEREREIAAGLHRALQDAAHSFKNGVAASEACRNAKNALQNSGFERVDYLEIRCAETLRPVDNAEVNKAYRILAAAWLGKTRLIDNIPC